jgi:hypothetical protein
MRPVPAAKHVVTTDRERKDLIKISAVNQLNEQYGFKE